LYLVSKEQLKYPTLYLSAYLEKNKALYYDALTLVRDTNDIGHWIRFFLVAVQQTAIKGRETFQAILALRNEVEQSIFQLGKRAENARLLLDNLYVYPIVTPKHVADLLGVTHQTAISLIRELVRLNILSLFTKLGRSQRYIFRRYVHLFFD
jgi:Fic family protein